MAGKGSSPRPYSVDSKTFASNWNSIFKKTEHNAISKDWYLTAINPWYKMYWNPETGEHKQISYK